MPNFFCHKHKQFPKNTAIRVNYHKPIKRSQRKCRPVEPSKPLKFKPTIWQDILQEDKEFQNYIRKEENKNLPAFECASSYLKRELFPHLVPAFEKLCIITLNNCVLYKEVRFFSFLDLLAELLYNTNPAHSERKDNWKSIHLICKNRYRPYYPYHWFLTPDEAAIIIQALIRGFLIRCKYDLEEMKEERRKILEGIEKQKKCYNALKEDIREIYDTSSYE